VYRMIGLQMCSEHPLLQVIRWGPSNSQVYAPVAAFRILTVLSYDADTICLESGKNAIIVPRGRIEDPPAPKIKIFSSAPAAGGCLPPL